MIKNICVVTHGYPTPINPGMFVFVDQLVSSWAEMGQKVTVINPIPCLVEYSDKKRFYQSEWVKTTKNGKCITIMSPRYFRLSDKKIGFINTQKIAYRDFGRVVAKTLRSMPEKPNVLYSHFLPAGCHVGDIGNEMGIPAFCAFGESSLWSIDKWDKKDVQNSLAKLTGMVSVSTKNKRILIENELFREKDIIIFPNGVDHSLFFPREKREARKRFGFPEDAFIGVYTGAFNDEKGVFRAQEAATRAGHVEMVYVGGGALKPEGENILFSGRLPHEEIPEYLSAADFFILPTKAEGCCNAIIEAMACGLPIISASGAYNDDILTEEYAIRTDPTDIDAMANAIRVLRDDPARRQRMSQAALNASLKFDITKRAAGILEFMQRKMQEG